MGCPLISSTLLFISLTSQQAILILNGIPGLGPVTQRRLLDAFAGDPVAVLSASAEALCRVPRIGKETSETIKAWAEHFHLAREEKLLAQGNVRFVTALDEDYPPLLREVYDHPIGLYAKGEYRPQLKTVAIVGSRRTTLYGQKVAKRLGYELARLGFCVVSGLARGIDTAAHEGALEAVGKTAAVLGCGVDIVYPPENVGLYKTIAEHGVIFSEFSFGTRASKTTFPMRNRLVSGMSQAVIVVESDRSGGSMITARMAIEQNRHVFAVPGRIDQASSRGCHQLIRDGGAALFSTVDDFLQELTYGNQQFELELDTAESSEAAAEQSTVEDTALSHDERVVYACFVDGSLLNLDQVLEQTGLPIQAVAATLLMLELKKKLAKRVDGTFECR